MRPFRSLPVLVLLACAAVPATAQQVPSPEEHFGFAMGTDRELARWDAILEYFTRIADGSDRIRVDTVGSTTLGNPYVAVTLTSPANLARLDAIRGASKRLAEGRIPAAEAEVLAAELPVTAFINHNIHSTEIASSQTSVDLVYRLATADDALTREILDNVVTVLVPSANPDGQIMVVDWYRQNVGTDFEDARMPWLYHHYAGHDNNRDYFQARLVETRHWMELMFHVTYPQLYLDQHQMGQTGPRIFVPPYPDPMNPDVHPLQWQALRQIGGAIVADLQKAGKQGVITSALYRIWGQEGALTGRYHNIVALLTESASVDIASPVEITREQLEASANRARDVARYGFNMQMVDPWWGGEWTLGDIVEYQTISALSYLKQAARYRREYVLGRWQMARETMERGEREGPYAYVIPSGQADGPTTLDLVRTLMLQGIEVHQAEGPFTAVPNGGLRRPGSSVLDDDGTEAIDDEGHGSEAEEDHGEDHDDDEAHDDDRDDEGDEAHDDDRGDEGEDDPDGEVGEPRSFPAGSWVVLASQPGRAAVLDLLQPVDRELQREYPGGPFLRSYDGAAYTMPLQMGVEAVRIDRPFEAELGRVEEAVATPPPLPEARRYWALSTSVNASFAAVNALLADGVAVQRARGWFLVSVADPRARAALEDLRETWGLTVAADPDGLTSPVPVRSSRVGLYQGWASSMDEGWTRLLLEQYGFGPTTLSNDDVRAGDLGERFDIVILPSEIPLTRLLDGAGEDDAPPEYRGGIGTEGVESLKAFVRGGGTLVTLDRGDAVVLEHFDVPVRDALDGVGSQEFFAPSSLYRLEVDDEHPLGDGTATEVAAKWAGGRAYEPTDFGGAASSITAVARWSEDPDRLLMSGLIAGAEHLAGKAAILDVAYGRGHITMYGFRVQHRAQTAGTFRLLFNALMRTGGRSATEDTP